MQKRIMKKIVVLVLVLALIFAISSSADVDTGFSCSLGCESLSQNGETYYCNQDSQTCFLMEAPVESASNETVTGPVTYTPPVLTTEEKVALLEENLASLQQSLAEVNSGVSLSNQDIALVKSQLAQLQAELTTLKGNIQTDLNTQTNSLSTGLAGLQQGINKTQEALQNLTEKQSTTRILTVIFLILIIAGVGAGIYYYLNRSKTDPEMLEYINSNIKRGKKLPQIKQELRKAGWLDSEIEKAYNEVVKQNYRQYKSVHSEAKAERTEDAEEEQRPTSRVSAQQETSNPMHDPKKMMIIAVVGILLITGLILVLRGVSTGQAIFFQKLIGGAENGTSGEITYKVECTPPHLLNPTGDACCLDSDSSGICDTTELQGNGLTAGGDCSDNRECKLGLYCVNKKCTGLDTLYTHEGGDCTKLCSYYAVKMITSDKESYDLKPKQGSYTGAGALEWKLLEMPQYCKGESAIVPVNIIKKQTGKKISEEVILLHDGESSTVLTHPTIPKLAFTLTLEKVFESCPK
ncbi:MAG TPA: hypothetical protein VJB13_01745 [Candidatus Nanoarchaeia archaeon]|nr:hypothetical protein [Candidatus Nanoarchaeia archaeon]